MPYINPNRRPEVINDVAPKTPGELNYLINDLLNWYLLDNTLSYTSINDCIGVLECVKLELYRRIVANYEDRKIVENGDVYSENLVKT